MKFLQQVAKAIFPMRSIVFEPFRIRAFGGLESPVETKRVFLKRGLSVLPDPLSYKSPRN
jgi:hypothetical protein